MPKINVYLNFEGNCEEAFRFYQSIFGGEFTRILRYSQMPEFEGMPLITEDVSNRIMHMVLPISDETQLMGCDTVGEWSPRLLTGNNFSVWVSADTKESAERIFNMLGKEGHFTMPMIEQFWGDYFGMVTDKFGINWMINFRPSEEAPQLLEFLRNAEM